MNLKEQNKRMLKTLRKLNKYNLGDYFEGLVRDTLVQVGKCPHAYSAVRKDGCIYCGKRPSKKTRK